ncbi:MAG TPA: amino acid adenylation domain-containing protein [Stellaceae bacterium]|nr:amino acid adenylation domain-containing protein [Stellaceae bacterium]
MSSSESLSDAKRRLFEKMLRGEAAGSGEQPTIEARPPGTVAPISIEQRNVWIRASKAPDLPLFNVPFTVLRKGSFDLGILERSLNEILRRHEIWRTAFEAVGDGIVQSVHPALAIKLDLVDLAGLPPEARESEARRIAAEDAQKPIDMTRVPLFRAKVLRLGANDHRLMLTLHHIIFDGVSVYRVLMPELAAIYEAFEHGRKSPLAEPALQYADYALWRERNAETAAVTTQMAYWRGALSGELPALQLPIDHPRPAKSSYRGATETFSLSFALSASLKELSRKHGVTLYMTLLAAFKALLFRYSGQEDILVGGFTDIRRRAEFQPLMGYFLNSIVLRSHPCDALSFRDYLGQVRDAVIGALGASDLPFDRVVREMQKARAFNADRLFQVLFDIETPGDGFADGWDLKHMDVTADAAGIDLYVGFDERPEGLIGRFIYSADLFELATIRRMIGHFESLLEGVVADPGGSLGKLPLLTAAERQEFRRWNDTAQPIPAATVHAWLEEQTRRTPEAVAVTFEGHDWTYRELDRRAERLAARLRAAGCGLDRPVAICVNRSLDMMAGLIAIMKAGGAYLPLDPALPPKRVEFILEDARPAVVLTQRGLAASLPPSDAQILFCDADEDDGTAATPVDGGAGPENLAYILYTSGSTGKPKGVAVPHRAVVNLLASMQREPGFGANDVLLAMTTFSFDIATLELFLPLVSGGRVVLADRETSADFRRLEALSRSSHCTVMQATPATWRGLIENDWIGGTHLTVLCGGEAMSRDLADKLLARCGSLWNVYGPTETTIWSCVHEVEAGLGTVSIGHPIANTSIHIVDAHGNEVPAGVAGELLIGGAGVTRGYLNRESLTREKFVTLATAPGERLYRTGDMARFRADGTIECLGRSDDQVKIRGFTVGLTEVEAALAAHPAIAGCAVVARIDASGEKGLVAYYVARSNAAPRVGEIRALLRETLPHYMVPARYMALAALPMTPNGKIDRKALPEPAAALEIVSAEPTGDREVKLARIWQEVLGIPKVGRQDDFHELGGHSLLVAKLLLRIEAEFGRRLPMAAIFNAPQLHEMAGLLADDAAPDIETRLINIQPKGARSPLYWMFGGPTVRPLAEAIGEDQPFYGVALDLGEKHAFSHSSTLAEIAAPLAGAMLDAQPDGPFFLGGWCVAGIVAFEVAQQLMAAGREVGLLAMVHAPQPDQFRQIGGVQLRASKLRYHWAVTRRLKGEQRRRYLKDRLRGIFDDVVDQLSVSASGTDKAMLALQSLINNAAHYYSPAPYAGDMALFQPADRPDVLDYRPGWRSVVRGGFASFEIPGGHRTMLEDPFVAELGARLNACLRRAQRQGERVSEPRRAVG